MRKITEDAAEAFFAGKSFSRDNTVVTVVGEEIMLILHGNPIATRTGQHVEVCFGGRFSRTSCERINGVIDGTTFEGRAFIRQWEGYIGSHSPYSTEWVVVQHDDVYHRLADVAV